MIFTNTGTNLTVKLNGATILNTAVSVPGLASNGWNVGAITESIGGTVAEMHVNYMYITATA